MKARVGTVRLALLGAALVGLFGASISMADDCAGQLHPAMLSRISKDVEWLDQAGGITDEMIRNISLVCDINVRHQCNVQAVRLMIKDGEVYLNSLQPEWFLGPHEFIGFLLELYETSKVYRLPDLEFAWNGHDDASSPSFDWAERTTLRANFHGGPFPLLAWSKSDESFAALVPYSGAFRCADDSFDTLLTRLDDLQRVSWSERKQIAFGRWNKFCPPYVRRMPVLPSGERFVCPRHWLPKLTPNHTAIMDVAVSGNKYGPTKATQVPLAHQNAFRYLVSTDGWAISSKFDKYLLLGSLIIKAHSSRFGYYYDALVPGEHFLPCMNSSMDDLVQRVQWAQAHDSEAAAMGAAAQQFAVRHLHRGARLCYYRTLLEELGKRMKYTPDCSQRKLCIPLGRFLEFLMKFQRTAITCRYQEVLIRYGVNRSVPQYDACSDAVLLEMVKDPSFWPRDSDTPPLSQQPYFREFPSVPPDVK